MVTPDPGGVSSHEFARVAVALPPKEPFTYRIPAPLRGDLQMGHALLVPFGPRKVTGYVLETTSEPDCDPARVKEIHRLLDPHPVFDAGQLTLFRWVADYYRASVGEVIATALPSGIRTTTKTVFRASESGVESLAVEAVHDAQAEVLREVVSRPGLTRRGLERRLRDLLEPKEASRALDALLRANRLEAEQVETSGPSDRVKVLRLQHPEEKWTEHLPSPGARQLAVLQSLAEADGTLDQPELLAAQGPYARTAVRRLLQVGLVTEELQERRDAVTVGELPEHGAPPTLNADQEHAVASILGAPRPWLLFGVTGSGKTEVYLRAAASVLERNQQVLVLVPEIGLTPQLVGRFRARFGDRIAVLHSGLTPSQRLREWRRIRAGDAEVAVGARSALFAPFTNLGLVVVDEEHDDSYKQDDGVRYSARDMAVVRSQLAGCPLVLGSATPSLETFHNAQEDRYGLLELPERATARSVPEVECIDMATVEPVNEVRPLLSPRLVEALQGAFDAGGKAIVLYNRRGYATFVQCTGCGGSYECPSCGVSLVLHQQARTLICHYCGFHRPHTRDCPHCHGTLEILGKGTERVEETLTETFPGIPVGRMDADTTRSRGAHHRILQDFSSGKIRLLVGTQMVAKGHDFPDVHVAAVIGGDHLLRMPDFRASERTFSLLTQLAGRAGRGDVPGRVLVQTHHPQHYALQHLGDYPTFFDLESRSRHLLAYPPYTRLVLLRVEGARKGEALSAAFQLATRLRGTVDGRRVQVLGPAAAAMPKRVGRWRYQVVIRGVDQGALRRWLAEADLSIKAKGVRLAVDVDPRHLM